MANSFLHSGKKETLNVDLAEHPVQFLLHYCSFGSVVRDISVLHSLILVPALTVHSHTFTLCEGHFSLKVKVMLDTTLWLILWCAGLLCGSPASSQLRHRILPCQHTRQENLHNRAKINGSGVKGLKDEEDWHPSSSSWTFNPQTPNRTTSPIIQSCLPLSKAQWHSNYSPSMGRTQSFLFPNLLMSGTRIY